MNQNVKMVIVMMEDVSVLKDLMGQRVTFHLDQLVMVATAGITEHVTVIETLAFVQKGLLDLNVEEKFVSLCCKFSYLIFQSK